MPLRPEQAHALLPHVDPARLRGGWPVGLRDGALLALIAAGLSAEEVAGLQASAVTMERGHVQVALHRHRLTWTVALSTELGARLLAWLTERRLWATADLIFDSPQRPLSAAAIHQILCRYRRDRKTCECE